MLSVQRFLSSFKDYDIYFSLHTFRQLYKRFLNNSFIVTVIENKITSHFAQCHLNVEGARGVYVTLPYIFIAISALSLFFDTPCSQNPLLIC